MIRAILLASATLTRRAGRRASSAFTHPPPVNRRPELDPFAIESWTPGWLDRRVRYRSLSR
jgi:hypothetical protein